MSIVHDEDPSIHSCPGKVCHDVRPVSDGDDGSVGRWKKVVRCRDCGLVAEMEMERGEDGKIVLLSRRRVEQ